MPVFNDKQTVIKMFGEIWSKMIKETEFGPKLRENRISQFTFNPV